MVLMGSSPIIAGAHINPGGHLSEPATEQLMGML
jgi:hypothetical protein